MTIDMETLAKILGLIIAIAGVVGVFGAAVGTVMMPKMTKAVRDHERECQLRVALAEEAQGLAKALAAEIEQREKGDARIERAVADLSVRIDAGFTTVNNTLLRLASGNRI